MSGKGSGRRRTEVTEDEFQDNWNKVFGEKKEKIKSKLKRTFTRKPKRDK